MLLRLTTIPPDGAFPVNVTVPVLVLPHITELGLTDRPLSAAGVMANAAVWLVPLEVAVIFAVALALTPDVVIVNVPVV